MPALYPLRFQPILRRYLWGGRRLGSYLRKPIGDGDDYAESWEVVDHGDDQSVVAAGPLAGTKLSELVEHHGPSLFGTHHPQPQFPLLFKYLDAQRNLSVQVHPDDARAAKLDPPDRGKTEAWVVVHAEPGCRIYAGLKRGFDRHALSRELARGTAELCLNQLTPQPGDCVFVPAGTVHALGAGLLVAEIQQASDTTYRLHDWGRLDADGKPRQLHIDLALEAIDYQAGPVTIQPPAATDQPHIRRLVACDKFVLDRWELAQAQPLQRTGRFHILSVLDGSLAVAGDAIDRPLGRGETILVPASSAPTKLTPHPTAVLLDMYLP